MAGSASWRGLSVRKRERRRSPGDGDARLGGGQGRGQCVDAEENDAAHDGGNREAAQARGASRGQAPCAKTPAATDGDGRVLEAMPMMVADTDRLIEPGTTASIHVCGTRASTTSRQYIRKNLGLVSRKALRCRISSSP